MKYGTLYLLVLVLFASPFSVQVAAAELCGGVHPLSVEIPLMDKEPEGEEGEEEEEPDCD